MEQKGLLTTFPLSHSLYKLMRNEAKLLGYMGMLTMRSLLGHRPAAIYSSYYNVGVDVLVLNTHYCCLLFCYILNFCPFVYMPKYHL